MPENPTNDQQLIDYITTTSAALEKAAEADQRQEQQNTAIAAAIPKVVQAMVANNRIEPGQAEKLARVLLDPVQALELLEKVAAHRNQDEIADEQLRLGAPVGGGGAEKTAGARYIGQRSPDGAQSDLRFLAHFANNGVAAR